MTFPFAVTVILLLPFCTNPLLTVVILPVVAINVVVSKLPVFALPVTDNTPPVVKLPPLTLPVAVISPAVPKLPTFALPVTVRLDNEPTLVMFGCAAVVTVAAVPAVATFKFATCVVDVTARGAVPVVTLEINCGAVILPVTLVPPVAVNNIVSSASLATLISRTVVSPVEA